MKSKIEEMKNKLIGKQSESKISEQIKKILNELRLKYKVNSGDSFLLEQDLDGQSLIHLCKMKSKKDNLIVDNSVEELLRSDYISIVDTIKRDFDSFKVSLDIEGKRNEELLSGDDTVIRDSIIYTKDNNSLIVKILKNNQFDLAVNTFSKINKIDNKVENKNNIKTSKQNPKLG